MLDLDTLWHREPNERLQAFWLHSSFVLGEQLRPILGVAIPV
jgi:hypothetical protein